MAVKLPLKYVHFIKRYKPLLFGICIGMIVSLVTTKVENISCDLDNIGLIKAVDIGDVEPKWNIESDPKPVKLKKITRPRFMSTELGIKKKLLIGILANITDVQTNGVALMKILNRIADKLLFFVQGKPDDKLKQLITSVVGFTDTRELLLPFYVMKYIKEHLDKFDYIYLATSYTYIHTHALSSFLKEINSGDHLYVGFPFDEAVSNDVCRLETGILLSQSIVQAIVLKLDWCARNAYADNHGVNLGRCIMHVLNLPCMHEVHQMEYKAKIFDNDSLIEANLKIVTRMRDINETITLYPVHEPNLMFELHRFYTLRKIEQISEEIAITRKEILHQIDICPLNLDPDIWPVGIPDPYKPTSRFTVISWEYFDNHNIYLYSELENLRKLDGIDKLDIQNVLDDIKNRIIVEFNNTLEFQKLLSGYRRYDPTRGMEYICDVLVLNNTNKAHLYKRFMAIRPICKVELVPMPYVTENKQVVLLLPIDPTVDSRLSASYFIHRYAHTCLESQDNTVLVLVYQYKSHQSKTKGDLFKNIQNLVQEYLRKYKDNSRIISLTIEKSESTDMMVILDTVLKTKKFPSDTLVLMSSSQMEIDPEFLNRVRMNTILHRQVYNPIPFMEFHPDIIYSGGEIPEKLEVNKNNGHFQYSEDLHISFYLDDYKIAKKMVNRENKPRNLLELFMVNKELHILQGIEPSLRLRYIHEDCSSNTTFYEHCLDKVSSRLGSRFQLGQLVLQYENEIQNTL